MTIAGSVIATLHQVIHHLRNSLDIVNPTDPERQGRGRGRRPADSGTREAIRDAASRLFAAHGYDRTSMRAVAAEAGVDPALITYFFGSKQRLFIDVVQLPVDPGEIIPIVFAGDRSTAGERLARVVLGVLDNEALRARVVGLVRAAASDPDAAVMARELISDQLVSRVVEQLDVDDGARRASLVGSQIVGLVVARHVIGIEPLASWPTDELARVVGPTLQRYLTGPLEPEA
jgi:AcrR family transcriptional regulator